ncbi:hypothetical protein BDQ17DRAFT_1363971, partial [Cyathus striatus]
MDHIERVLGPLLIGVGVNTYIYGLTVFQYASYYITPFKDSYYIKLPVTLLFLVDFYQNILVTNYENPNSMDGYSFLGFYYCSYFDGICGLVAHIFQGYRMYKLTGMKPAFYAIILHPSSAIIGFTDQVSMLQFFSHNVRVRPVISLWLSIQSLLDTGLSVVLLMVLLRTSAFMPHLSPSNRALRAFVQSGMFTATFSLAALLSYIGSFNTTIYMIFSLAVGRLYSNLVLDTLIARGGMRSATDSKPICTRVTATESAAITLSAIHVQTETYTDATTRASKSRPSRGGVDMSEFPSKMGSEDEV